MPLVAVELEDLETLLCMTGTLCTIEALVQARKTDPWVREHEGRFAAAHDRVHAAVRDEKRKADMPGWTDPLTAHEARMLDDLDYQHGQMRVHVRDAGEWMTLQRKGAVEIGTPIADSVAWPSDGAHPTLKPDSEWRAVRLRTRGQVLLRSYKEEQGSPLRRTLSSAGFTVGEAG